MYQHGKLFLRLLLAVVTLSLAVTAFADTGLGRHKKMYVVPATKKVTIDGKLDDWDLSAQITMYVVSETSDMQGAKFAMMYDKDALYLSAVVRDPTPMMNRHDPNVTGDYGWDADSCQFRLTLDPTKGYPVNIGYGTGDMDDLSVVHMTLWYYTDKQQPCLQMASSMHYKTRPEWGKFGAVPQNLFQAKYLKMDDGRGYTFEYRIPWKTLGAKAPLQGGDLVAGTVQFNWSKPDGLNTNGGWAYDVMAGPGFPYQATSCWGKFLISATGHLPREMVEDGVLPDKPVPLKFSYDLPQDSQITIQLEDKDKVVRRILVPQGNRLAGKNVELWDGMDDRGKPLPAGEYRWRGIYHQPLTQKYLFSPHSSGQPSYATDDGTGGWGADESNPQDTAAFDGGMILSWGWGEAGWALLRTDFTGKRQWGNHFGAFFLATNGKRIFTASQPTTSATEGVKVQDIADSRPLIFGNGKPNLPAPDGGDAQTNSVSGIACAGDIVYVAYQARNLIGRFDANSGDLKGTWTVPSPGRLAVRPDGGLAVISGDSVVAIKDGMVTKLAVTHLDKPTGIAVGPDGLIYVACAGKLQNISVFDANGAYQRSIGIEGGRPAKGRYNPNGILEPGGMSLDKNGHLWVAERLDCPRRISEWDAKTGALVNEFFGGCDYAGYAYIDPQHADEIYCHQVLWKIDWTKNTCSPVSTVWRPTAPNMMWATSSDYPVYFTAKNGKQYCYGSSGPFMTTLAVRDGDLYKPFAAVFAFYRNWDAYVSMTRVFSGDPQAVAPFPVMNDAKKYPTEFWCWQDKNDDQTVQDDELTPVPSDIGAATVYVTVDEDLNMYIGNGVIRPLRTEANGQAVYDFTKLDKTPWVAPGYGPLWLDPNDHSAYAYKLFNVNPADNRLAKFTADGTLQWAYPGMIEWKSCLDWPMQAPGRLYGCTTSLGLAGNFTGMSNYFGGYHLFTRDGIYVGMLMRDGRDGKGLGPDITASETFTGQLVKLDNLPGSAGKSRYFLIAGAADARITEIFGLDTVKPLPGGTLTLSETDAKLASDALAEYNTKLAKGRRLSIVRGQKALASAQSVSKILDATRSFSARAAYDEKNLYVVFDVTSPCELVNSYPDQATIFKGGNCLDIQLATDPTADPKRKTPAPGDVRILVTQQNGKPFVEIYRPKVKGFTGKATVMTSPTGTESFDNIEVSEKIGLTYQKTLAGYTATVTIPCEIVGLSLQPGQQVRMDLGMLYGNAAGTQTAARSYWINNSFSANVTYDIPNESRLEPAEWGTAVVE